MKIEEKIDDAARPFLRQLMRDLESPREVRRFGSGWLSGFFALLLAISALLLVIALKFPEWFATPELELIKQWGGFRVVLHAVLLASYVLSLLSLLLRPRKALGLMALMIGIAAALLGGSNVEADGTRSLGVFFGLDFFIVNLLATGFMFAPLERFRPHRREQRLFRNEWREDLFYFLISTMFVQILAFLTLAPSNFINEATGGLDAFRAFVADIPWVLQFLIAVFVSDLAQYWYHRLFHQVPFLWGFHAVHHSAKSMDWLAGSRMHIVEVIMLRMVTSLPLFTLGFSPSVLQAYIGFVYVYSSLLHANVGGNFNRLGHWLATPRFHHWHHGLEREAFDVNFAIHFPWIDKMFGTFHLPEDRWPKDYGIPEDVPRGYAGQFLYPWTRTGEKTD
ncbi:sterol desaturase family protein [Pontixanthobacter aquaemixtae]|uniref:Sterol desaturase family protein n=1 Tax=Pontixanthobacter aquaemixtae TaxID=1958940 RepID=A0A844ZQ41_9SPHN|nr:sterol desaturase family protein [Pontixanthobacter aquaemixtae]MXO90461.1 sterol desaturase family protein [Pontixanthobacter aquaemixtae]